MRICIVTHCFPRFKNDVFGNWTPDFAQLLLEKGQDVFVLTPRMAIPETNIEMENWPFRVDYFDWGKGDTRLGNLNLLNPYHFFKLAAFLRNGFLTLRSLVESHNIDLCLSIWAIPAGYLAYRIQKEMGIPYAIWSLGSDINVYGSSPPFRRIIKKVLARADYLFANSRNLMERISEWSGKSCEFMPTNRVLPKERVTSSEEVEEKNTFVFVGRLEKVKGVDVLIEAVSKLCGEGFHPRLYIVGDGEDRAFLEKAVSDAQLHESIFFKGWASPEEVASYIQASDAVVIPSRSEGMPVIFWESMQMDTPVIVTDVGDMADYTREFGVGKVVPPENSNKLKESMRDFMEDKIHIDYDNIKALAEESSLTKAADTFLNTIVPHFHTKNASI